MLLLAAASESEQADWLYTLNLAKELPPCPLTMVPALIDKGEVPAQVLEQLKTIEDEGEEELEEESEELENGFYGAPSAAPPAPERTNSGVLEVVSNPGKWAESQMSRLAF